MDTRHFQSAQKFIPEFALNFLFYKFVTWTKILVPVTKKLVPISLKAYSVNQNINRIDLVTF